VLNSRVWLPQQQIQVSASRDYSYNTTFSSNGSQSATNDYTVVNVVGNVPYQMAAPGLCAFSIATVPAAQSLKNVLLVVNATIDMNQVQDPSYGRKFDSICTKAYVSVFDDFNGTLNNVTVIGFINITGSTVAKTLYLSRLFGGVPQVSDRAAFFTANVINTSSNLQFYVDGTQITTATNTVA